MRILHVVHGLPRGGLERGVINLANHLPRPEFVQAICCLDQRGDMATQVDRQVEIFELHRHRYDVKLPFKLASLIRRWRPDVIHCRNWNAWPDSVAAHRLSRLLGGRRPTLVWSFHGFVNGEQLPLRRRLASRVLSALTDDMVAVSHDTALRFARQVPLPATRFQVLYNGVDCQRFHPDEDKRMALRRALGLSPHKVLALTVASLIPIKNHERLLEAIAALTPAQQAHLELVLVGDGPLHNTLQARIKALALAPIVRLVGASDHVQDYLQAADFFILPSRLEGMSNAILEAMASGLAVIAHKVGGNPELIVDGETGLVCELDQPLQLTQAIGRLIEDTEFRRLAGQAARRRAATALSIEAMIGNYAQFYRSLGERERLIEGPE